MYIEKATNLCNINNSGNAQDKSDPQIIVTAINKQGGRSEHSSNVIKNSLNPVWTDATLPNNSELIEFWMDSWGWFTVQAIDADSQQPLSYAFTYVWSSHFTTPKKIEMEAFDGSRIFFSYVFLDFIHGY